MSAVLDVDKPLTELPPSRPARNYLNAGYSVRSSMSRSSLA